MQVGGPLGAAGLSCGSCGRALPPNSKFCSECGAPVVRVGRSAEYKQVTVLFADVVRSMDIAAALDIERFRDIMTEVVERATAVARRFGGTVEHTGDGVMAIFGAPVAQEDHAFRACSAALAIQEETDRVASEVRERDGIELRMRVGLNSGRVIAGDTGAGPMAYRATGSPVGFAQRMESVAPPGGVVVSESTARLVEDRALLTEPHREQVKGADQPVWVRQLLAIAPRDGLVGRAEASLVGRRWEMAALEAMLHRAIGGRGGVVNVAGPPGIGKSRTAREAAALASGRGVDVFWTFCESHASDIPFHVVTRLLRVRTGVADLDSDAARTKVREQIPDADPQDLLLLDDLLGIADPEVQAPQIDPEARRRRLTALINAASLASTASALVIIEDAQWIDAVSESMLADFLTVVPRTASMVLITSRPEYQGALTRVRGAQSIALAPLSDSDTTALVGELLGSDSSVGELTTRIAERAAGNPFFAEEMVRALSQRGVLQGSRGAYVGRADSADVTVPATVEATIAARIDAVTTPARRTLAAAAVIGARFGTDLLAALGIDAAIDELLDAELIDQVRFTPTAEYAFRHPLIRAVAYESQLKSDRAQWHRQLAAAIRERAPVEENAALIAEHLEAAGELQQAHSWHMRAAAWSTNRDITAARLSWERARRIADALPDDPARLSLRIAPRTMLCATGGFGGAVGESHGRFAELRELCTAAGDKVSLVIAIAGPAAELLYAGRAREAALLASEQMELLESIGDPGLTIGLAFAGLAIWFEAGEFGQLLRWSQTVVELADGDPAKGANFGIGSPLAAALAWRGTARWWLGRPGWRQDLHNAVAMARNSDPTTFGTVVCWTYSYAAQYGLLRPDDDLLRVSEEAVQTARDSSNWVATGLAEYTLGVVLLCRDDEADRSRGLDIMVHFGELLRERKSLFLVPLAELWIAQEQASRGDRDAAITAMHKAVDELHRGGRLGHSVWGSAVLVQTLLERGTDGDLAEAGEAIVQLANLRTDQTVVIRDITLLRLRALLAHARGDDGACRDLTNRYRATAQSFGFEGDIWTGR